jgi:hypothetical protein
LWVNKYAPKSFLHLLSDEVVNCIPLALRRFSTEPTALNSCSAAIATSCSGSSLGTQLCSAKLLSPVNPMLLEKTMNRGHCQSPRLIQDNFIHFYTRVFLTNVIQIMLLNGPPGVGKTTLVHILARQAGYMPMEINARFFHLHFRPKSVASHNPYISLLLIPGASPST